MNKKIRFFWRLLTTLIVRRKELIFLGFFVGITSFFLGPRILSLLPKAQPTENIGLVGLFTLKDIPLEIQSMVSLGLTHVQEDGTPKPEMATSWIVEDRGQTYTFTLGDNLRWHDGSAIEAKDINYNFKDVETEILNNKTIKFKLKEPFAPFPVVVSKPLFKKGLIGAGDYKVEKLTLNGELVKTILFSPKDKDKPKLRYLFYPTESAAKTALKLGEVRSLERMVDANGFEGWQNIKIISTTQLNHYLGLFFNTSKELLGDKNLRQALAYAIPKDPDENRASGPLSSNSWAYNDDVKPYTFDLANAKKLFSKASDNDKKVTLRLATTPSLLPQAAEIEKAWKALGVKTEIEAMIDPKSMDYEVLLAIQEIPLDPDQYSLWHSTQETANVTKLKNHRIDQLLEDGRKTIDQEKRKSIYLDFQRFIVEEIPVIFLYYPISYTISHK